jgi:tetratricopeptide (TPR) repeat protein
MLGKSTRQAVLHNLGDRYSSRDLASSAGMAQSLCSEAGIRGIPAEGAGQSAQGKHGTMLEWLLVAAPVAFSALIFGLALGSQPIDVLLQHITTPDFLEQQGYAPGTLDDIIERQIAEIVDGAASLQTPRRIDLGTPETAINAFADMAQLVQPVRATQRFVGLVDYIAEIHFLTDDSFEGTVRLGDTRWEFEADQDETVVATLRIRDSDTLQIVKYQEMEAGFEDFDDLLDRVAREIVGFVDPYILALYLYNEATHSTSDDVTLLNAVNHLKAAMPLVPVKDRHWYHNLLCHISNQLGDPELAIEYCREAVRWRPDFALAHANWGVALARLDRDAEAIERYEAALRIQPDLVIARVYLAELLHERRLYDEALAQLDLAQARAPELARIYEVRGVVYDQVEVPELAQQQRRRADVARARQPRQSYYAAL